MEELVMCGICLNMNVKMYKLVGYALEDYYVCIIGSLLEANISTYLQYVCYECAYDLKKYNLFREKCLRSHSILFEMVQRKGQIKKSDITSIDRQELKLCSNLEYGSNNMHTIEHTYIKKENLNDSLETIGTNNFKEIQIKIEADLQETEEDETITSNCNDEEDTLATSIKSEETPKKQKIKKTSERKVKKPFKKRRLKKSLKEDSTGDTSEGKRKPLKKTFGPKRHPTGLTPREREMADRIEVAQLTIEEQMEEVRKRKESSNYIECKYKCNICYKGFADTCVYDNHMKRHDLPGAKHVCPICKICFPSSRTLSNHRRFHEKIYKCKQCPHVCNSINQAVLHQNEHSGKTYKCKQCDYVTAKLSSHLSHVRIKHPSEFVCSACGFSFVSEKGLRLHKALMHNKETGSEKGSINMSHCEACDFHCSSRQDWNKHVASVGHKIKINDFNCDVCKITFATGEDFNSHYRSVHPLRRGTSNKTRQCMNDSENGSKNMRHCEVCDFQCSSRQYWKKHMASVVHKIKTNDFTCGICKDVFATGEDLKLHYRKLHPVPRRKNQSQPGLSKEWPRKCAHCDEMSSTIRKYYYHIRTSHPDQPDPVVKNHICDVCGKRFRNNTLLQYHRRTHFEGRSFKCTECSKSFFSKTILQLHKSSHSDARPYSCDDCHKAYKTKNNLRRHLLSHTGERPYPCNYCGKAFADSSNRRIHITTVHFKMPVPYKTKKRHRLPRDEPERI